MSVLKSDADKAQARQAPIVKLYRSIGPAAVLAAVLAAKKRQPVQKTAVAKA